ncbi:hypothetical protein CDD82_6051 [Ophiocordyceps australis]|uniref:Mob1/phocein family protein n=1 Tax=Ophiocordyceps australis TaxID=1399860 RepID=A0A2C5YU22_9HYPO|nr:hypothetical protein CDD82_6051 [Ophiocordyceps australis]
MALAPNSPRLPSPPPPAEIQIGPKSPSGAPVAVSQQAAQMQQTLLDANSRRRVHPGTKASDMAAGPPLVPLNELDSAFQLQEHLAALHYHHTDSGRQPLTRAIALELSQPPSSIDRTLWLYELCRFLISKCNSLIVGFLFDTPPCSAMTCPEMRASEWQFLCAVHEQPKSCCAIDYCCHTLDWAANVVSDQKIFPSRFVVLNDHHSRNVAVKNLVNVFRRLHRIFAHAWFQHRDVFWTVEGQTGLYLFFKTVCDLYDLLPSENYKLPPEAEGLDTATAEPEQELYLPTILKPPSQQQRVTDADKDDDNPPGRTTRRHIRSSPSTGSAVTTVMEADEEPDANQGISEAADALDALTMAENGAEVAEVPVMVEQPRLGVDIHETTALDNQENSFSHAQDSSTQVEETNDSQDEMGHEQDFGPVSASDEALESEEQGGSEATYSATGANTEAALESVSAREEDEQGAEAVEASKESLSEGQDARKHSNGVEEQAMAE